MSRILKIAALLAILSSITACTVLPPQVAYTESSVGVVVGPAPYYAAPAPYYGAPRYYGPPAYYGAPRYGGPPAYYRPRYGYRRW